MVFPYSIITLLINVSTIPMMKLCPQLQFQWLTIVFPLVRPKRWSAIGKTAISLSLGTVSLLSSAGLHSAQASVPTNAVVPSGWQRIVDLFSEENEDQRDSSDNGSRPVGGVCLVSPQHQQVLWHREPLMIWQSAQTTVGIRPQGATDTVLWSATATPSEATVFQSNYQGTPLALGETYEWLFYLNPERPSFWFRFDLMAAEQYAQHEAALEALQVQLEASAASVEDVAVAQANYFLDNNLPADALQAIFAVGDPSPELLETQAALVTEICGDE
jgi:hypothetical protein